MSITLRTPSADELGAVVRALGECQHEGASVPLHPGDVGWYGRFGAAATAAATRTWSRGERLLAVGLLDGPGVLRLAVAPEVHDDDELATRMLADVSRPDRGVLGHDGVVEARSGARLRRLLHDNGWVADEAWTPLRRDLNGPVAESGLRIEVTGPESAASRVALQRAAFEGSTFSLEKWRAMAEGPAYADARCLVGYDGDVAVAAVTLWSAGPGRPGLLEPMGVHREHRGRGFGRGICLAAAASLRELGASSATVCTPSANAAGVATYESAGFASLGPVTDFRRAVEGEGRLASVPV